MFKSFNLRCSSVFGTTVGKSNDILAHTTLEPCGYQSDDLTFNFTEGRNPILGLDLDE